ncbi:MAG: hypothetical protein Q9204_001253 [Flavoplaca sp. TL-2023a]
MQEVPNNIHNGHFWAWYEAMLAKFNGEGPLYSLQDFDKILQDYSAHMNCGQAVTDIPCNLFPEDLMIAYPNAKVILTTRPVDVWLKSLFKIHAITDWKSMQLLAKLDPDIAKYLSLLRIAITSWSSGNWRSPTELATGFHRHNDHIRSLVQTRGAQFLEFRSEDGWAPLCKFLGKPVPNEPYPYINAGDGLERYHYKFVAATAVMMVGRWMIKMGSVAGVIYIGWLFRNPIRAMGSQRMVWPVIMAINRAYEFAVQNVASVVGVGFMAWLGGRWLGRQ